MKVGFIQFCPQLGRKERNVKEVLRMMEGVSAELIVLPELFDTGYLFASRDELVELAEEIPEGQTTQTLLKTAEDRGIHVVAGIAERSGDKIFNTAILVHPDRRVGTYRKAHLFMDEKTLFSPGNTPFKVWKIGAARIGMLICFDWIFPEATRTLSLGGAQIICHPSNLLMPWAQAAMITRAIENRVFIVTANRIGKDQRSGKKLQFTGMSQIVDPEGEILYRAEADKPDLGVVEIDAGRADDKRINEQNNIFQDRRPELYKLGF
jgi:predicted amidohydrolase